MDFHVLTTHRGVDDETPLQLISAEQLAYYQQVEAAYLGLLQRLAEPVGDALDPQVAGP